MLYKLTSTDKGQTTLIDCATGTVAFRISTPRPARARASTLDSLKRTMSRNCSQETVPRTDRPTTLVEDKDGAIVAEIDWAPGNYATLIRIGEEVLRGVAELFDCAFFKLYNDETQLPMRTENTWCITPTSLTLVDDDGEVIGKFHAKCVVVNGQPLRSRRGGYDYFELDGIPQDEVLEIILCLLFVRPLYERVHRSSRSKRTRLVAGLRRRAIHSFAGLRKSLATSRCEGTNARIIRRWG
ncbi:hypothetical protein BKA93DRAFT_738150 [Sparassis latifolia]|uniref:Uncharacterized protein n=1 Tax=Sparassis crispa TaxID=139825 RepID=A0A401GHZ0_9APHY|nr:predicted protein [Sparassis crispa]GBE81810.1 predicted protein [Sparassis crispa]